jgi:DNA-binding NarL/FixJ family response regulator
MRIALQQRSAGLLFKVTWLDMTGSSSQHRPKPWGTGLKGHLLRYRRRIRLRTLERRSQILRLRAQGLSFRAIGRRLGVSGACAHQNWRAIWNELAANSKMDS